MKKAVEKKAQTRKTHPKIIVTAIAALGFIVLSFSKHWSFILPAVILWWMNKKYIKKFLS